MKLNSKILSFLCVLSLCVGSATALAVQQGGSYFYLTSNPVQRLDWYCYAMDNWAHPTWSKYSWCTLEAPNGNIYLARNWIQVAVTGNVCATGAPWAGAPVVYSQIPTNSTAQALSAIWHNTLNYSHSTNLNAVFQAWWNSSSPVQNYPTSSVYTASTSCP
jgi:hypothetical protein